MTEENGAYSVGPMHSDVRVEVTAKKDGYVLTEREEKGNFVAMKLGQITIKVVRHSFWPPQSDLNALRRSSFQL